MRPMRAEMRLRVQPAYGLPHALVHLRKRTPAPCDLDSVHAVAGRLPLDRIRLVTRLLPVSIRGIVGGDGTVGETYLVRQRLLRETQGLRSGELQDSEDGALDEGLKTLSARPRFRLIVQAHDAGPTLALHDLA